MSAYATTLAPRAHVLVEESRNIVGENVLVAAVFHLLQAKSGHVSGQKEGLSHVEGKSTKDNISKRRTLEHKAHHRKRAEQTQKIQRNTVISAREGLRKELLQKII